MSRRYPKESKCLESNARYDTLRSRTISCFLSFAQSGKGCTTTRQGCYGEDQRSFVGQNYGTTVFNSINFLPLRSVSPIPKSVFPMTSRVTPALPFIHFNVHSKWDSFASAAALKTILSRVGRPLQYRRSTAAVFQDSAHG